MTEQHRKQKGIQLLKQLDIYKPYIKGFEQKDQVCFFENYGGYWVYQEPQVEAKMKQIEQKYKCTVYAITHEFAEFGECFSFLIVPQFKQDWDNLVFDNGCGTYYVYAYVWNKDDDMCSEFGDICVRSFGGGIKRIG